MAYPQALHNCSHDNSKLSCQTAFISDMQIDVGERIARKQDESSVILEGPHTHNQTNV